MLESRTRRGVRASWLVAICVSVGLTTTTTSTSSAASVPCHPGCNIVGGYCGPSGGCRCRPGWTGALCDTRRPRPLSSSPTPGAHRCNTDTTTTTTTTTTMTTSMGDQPLCPGHGSPCVAGGPGESGCPPREDPCSTPGSPREVTTSTRGCQQPHVSPLTTFTSQTPSHQPPQQQQPPPQQQQPQQQQLLLLQQQQQQHQQQQSQPHPHLQHSQQHHHRQQNERQLQHPRVEHRAAQQHLTPPLPLISLGPPTALLRRREVTMAQRRSTARVPDGAGFDSGSGSMSDWQRRWACVGALASFTSLVLLGSIALVFKPRWETWAANVRHRRLIERHRGRAARDGSTWHIEEEAAAATPRGGKRADEGESARLLGSCA
ncbi:potassium/sodium hyperpolarization-activated cyclic nucleotide-gated channel 1-like [Lethenteron reissneri]|uniref:potassium/sodium hyperpolarization-activated cyclic nucleotide-gated channel 1-like n=1 Tax=Lethenteron reissneri TaxID=7753 RepID=UPI002AB7EFA3|nr:potassium/sodium hyperpolarization-activated cyclic nucleotide-gated channel 1-like [Lethenteron reissneri]